MEAAAARMASIRLPVLRGGAVRTGPARRRASTIARWRAGVLVLVHVVMVTHVVTWWVTGRSPARFVLSDSMRTLELGEINPGFVLFVVALGVTAVLGRFMCGWICHMGALQDLCAWILRKFGVRPRLFRARLLGYVPLGLAVYMFVWPSVRREAQRMFASDSEPSPGVIAAVPQFPGWSSEWTTDALWEGLPSWGVAVPFLLLCGCATVYFLGARGLCRYGCPYGGLLLPAEQVAPVRVAVDASKCDGCGICTAACTTGVRVLDEVRRYGAVMDRNCVRTFDCVGACPRRALSFRPVRPAAFRRGKTRDASRFDLTLREEIACLGAFVAVFFVARGLYDLVPMLLAGTLGVLAGFLTWKTIRLFSEPNIRLAFATLRRGGQLTPAGKCWIGVAALVAALLAHSAGIRGVIHAASREDDLVTTSYAAAWSGAGIADADRRHAARAARLYAMVRPFWRGGWALASTPDAEIRLVWSRLVSGDRDGAEALLRELADHGRHQDQVSVELARSLLTTGRVDEAKGVLVRALARAPRSADVREALVSVLAMRGEFDDAEGLYRAALKDRPADGRARAGLGRLLLGTGRAEEGISELRRVAQEWPRHTTARRDLAVALFMNNQADQALDELRAASEARPAERKNLEGLADRMREAAGQPGQGGGSR